MPPIAILVALADPTRCRLIELLRAGPQPVHVLAAAFKISRPAISRHLRVLKQSGLISESKFGRENRYALHPRKLAPVQRWLTQIIPVPKEVASVGVGQAVPDIAASVESAPELKRQTATPKPVIEAVQTSAPSVPARPRKQTKPTAPKAEPLTPSLSQMGFDF